MDRNIQKILEDLYTIEPELKKDELKLIQVISKLVSAKPNPQLDPAFVARLKQQLIKPYQAQVSEDESRWSILSIINTITMKKVNYAIGLVVVVLVAVAGAVYLDGAQKQNKVSYNGGLKITAVAEQAFGDLDKVSEASATGQGGGNNSAAPLAADTSRSSAETLSIAPGTGMGGDAKMFAPYEYNVYRYVYKGDDLILEEPKLEVLKRLKGEEISGDIGGLMGSLNFGLVDIGSFSNLRLQSANFAQPGVDGYNIYVSVDEGMISINGAWPQYPMETMSSIKAPYEMPRITEDQIPDDNELIAIANQFVNDHQIPTQAYGMPEVQNDWRRMYELASDKSIFYFPDMMNVVYPLKINDQFVYDESGNKTGLNLGISLRNKKVVSVYDLSVQSYQSSMYDAETDVSRIIKVAERGGVYGYLPTDSNAKIVDVELGAPKLEFVKMWNYVNNKSEELLIPSLIFPVLDAPTNEQYFRKSVVVPLIKEILNRGDEQFRIMPMGSEGSAPAVDLPIAAPTPAVMKESN